MLQTTYERFAKILPKENIYICSCKRYLDLLKEQLPGLPEENILLEPIHRNTAPSVAWATMRILRRNPEANIVVTPSDQLVLNLDSFYHSINVGIGYVAENDVLLAMGVKPTRPEPGYGYIQLGDLSCKPEVFRLCDDVYGEWGVLLEHGYLYCECPSPDSDLRAYLPIGAP